MIFFKFKKLVVSLCTQSLRNYENIGLKSCFFLSSFKFPFISIKERYWSGVDP
ncbi:hypothetical protein Patl1_10487 [Pistacia atlantica]|uniref:Uncharacterized protein n=1 Tax=Pistacia atlantica TaxID=434234 RepID=A0ACC1A774_9ROSI|nr:hypothetical protein Patl1_10487 [Pistacia atlantica]